MTSEYVTCPYCGQDDSTPWAEENGWQAVKCVPCGVVYVNPRPSSDSVHEAAQLGVHYKEVGSFEVIGRFHPTRIRKLRKRLLDLFPDGDLRSGTIRWLDIGTGYGELLIALQDLGGDQVVAYGVEPCRPKLEKAQSMGLNVEESLAPITGEYEYISLINVFSHIPDPRQFIMWLRQYLKPGGELLFLMAVIRSRQIGFPETSSVMASEKEHKRCLQ